MLKSKTPTNKHLCNQLHWHVSKRLARICDELHELSFDMEKREFTGDMSVELVKLFCNN